MRRLYHIGFLAAGVCLLTILTLVTWQAVQADWVHRLFGRTELSLKQDKAESMMTSASSVKAKSAAFARIADLSPDGESASLPVASVLTDLNEDGRLDLVTAHEGGMVSVRAGRADGSFGAAHFFQVDAQVGAMAAGDFTGDGSIDLLVADSATERVLVMVGDGRGGFPEARRVNLIGAPARLLVKDFLGDQRAEVVVAVTAGAKTELLLWPDIAWLHPMTEAALQATTPRTLALDPIRLTVPLAEAPSYLEASYVDSDSYADILVVGQQQISVLYGDATAPWQRQTTVMLEQPQLQSVVGDFDGDVRAEVAVLDRLTHDVIIYSQSAGQWGVRERLNVGAATALAAADINGDRVSDLVVLRSEAGQVAIFPGSRQGRLGGEQTHTVQGAPMIALPAYLDKDELTDLVIIKQRGVSLLLTTQAADRATEGGVGDSPITAIDPLEYDIQVPEGECRTVPITITIAPTVFRPLDIYLLVDATQSYNDNIADFVRDGERFVDDLIALRGDIRLGIGKFRDYPIRPFGTLIDFAYKRILDFKQVNLGNRAAFINAIRDIHNEGGGDDPEAQLAALFQAATGAGQTVPGIGRANIPPGQQASFRQNVDVEKIIVLLTDSNFHNAGDPGSIPYPGPSFADTIAALNARNIKVIGMAAGGPGGDASITVNALRQIAAATATLARRDIDCDGNGTIDIRRGEPIVCPPPSNGAALKDVILSVVRGFDLPVPLTLEIDRDCSPITFMIDPPVQFVNPLTGGTFTFNVTFCAPCPSAPFECRFETKVILDEIIRARIPSRVEAVRPVCEVSPSALNFGDVCVGQSATQPLTIRNTGNGSFTVNAIVSSNPAFSVASTSLPLPATVAPSQSLTANIQFTCTSGGAQDGLISFVTDPPRNCVTDPLCAPVPASGFCVQIAGDVNPRGIDFGNLCVGQSASQNFVVTNTGNRPFTITSVNSSNPAFSVAPSGGVTIDPGSSATFTVTFTCTTSGAQSGIISFTTSNATNCPFDLGVVNVNGTCIQPVCQVSPASLDFGSVCVGASANRSFTVSNTGNAPFTINAIASSNAAFSVVSPALPVTVSPGGSVTVTVRFSCTTPGPQSGTISFVTDSVCGPVPCGTVAVSGTCLLITCSVSPTALNFGDVCVGASADRSFTVSNTGNGPFTINAIASSNAAFSVVSPALPVTVSPGGSVTVTVRFSCTTAGPQSGTLSFVTSSACGPVDCGTVTVTGTCLQITGTVNPTSLNFGDVCVGASAERTFTITNTGNGPFTVSTLTPTNPAFSVVSPALPITLNPGESATVTVRLTCTTPGAQTGQLVVSANSPCGPILVGVIDLSGFCVQVTCDVLPQTIDFGQVCVGASAEQGFKLRNTGNRDLTLVAIVSSNPAFTIVSPALPVTVPPGDQVNVVVRFTCTAPGPQSGTISFVAQSQCGPVDCGTVTVSGTCVQPVCLVTPSSLDFGQVMSPGFSEQTLVVSNPGNLAFTINAINSSNAAFSIISPALPATVPAGGSVTVTVRFTCAPGSSGVQSGTLTFSTSSLCGPVLCADISVMGECFVGPICKPRPASIDFGSVLLNQTQRTGELNPNGPPVCPPVPGTMVVPRFEICNNGDRPLEISAASSDNPRFTVLTPLPITIPPGACAEIVLQFEAREVGPTSGVITFVSNASNAASCFVQVRGTGLFGPDCIFVQPLGTAPDFNFDLPFPDIVVGDSTTENGLVQILNVGDQPLIINQGGRRPEITNLSFTVVGFDLDGIIPPLDLPLDPNPAVPAPEICILPGDSVFMLVRFTGLDIGEQVGAIQIFSNDPANIPTSPSCVLKNVRGRVVRPAQCQVTPNTLTLNAFAACTSAQETVTVANVGDLGLVISNITTTNPEIQVIDPLTNLPPTLPITVPGGGARQFLIRCTPLSEGTRTATIRFITNDPNPSACVVNVTCVATRGPICQVVMPDVVAGAPDGKTFGEVVIVPVGDPMFGTVGPTGLPFGEKRLPIEVRNVGDADLVLLPPPAPFTSNPFVTNVNFIVEGFTVGQVIPPGGVATGTVIFRPTLRQLQEGTIRFFTNTCVGECVLTGVNGIGITNAVNKGTPSLNVGTAPVGGFVENSFLMVNRGDRPLVISDPSQIVIDNPVFSVVSPLPIIVPPEFRGGGAGVAVTVRFTPTVAGQQIGRITFNYSPTDIGPVLPFTLNVSGTGTSPSSAVTAQPVAGDSASASVPVTGGRRPVLGKPE